MRDLSKEEIDAMVKNAGFTEGQKILLSDLDSVLTAFGALEFKSYIGEKQYASEIYYQVQLLSIISLLIC